MWKDDCWILGVDATEETVRRSCGKEFNPANDLVVTADPDLAEAGLGRLLETLAYDPPLAPVTEYKEGFVVYNNTDLTKEEMTVNLRKIVDLLRPQ